MNNKHYFKKSFVLLMEAGVLTFGLGSCANMSDTTKTYAQATGIGAAGGAGVGALAGQAIGGDTKSTVIGAAIGGSIGAIAGWFWGGLRCPAEKRIRQCRRTDQTQQSGYGQAHCTDEIQKRGIGSVYCQSEKRKKASRLFRRQNKITKNDEGSR